MNVIFLDIDGVMVTMKHLVFSERHVSYEFSPHAVDHLRDIIRETNAKIVVSSTWRKGESVAGLRRLFNVYELGKYVVGKTPVLEQNGWDSPDRGLEIQAYIDQVKGTKKEVSHFVILDDDQDMAHLLPYLVQTTWEEGLNEESKQKTIQQLKGER